MWMSAEIYVRNPLSVVELWYYNDVYEGFMEPYFRLFARYAAWAVGNQRHLLTYSEDVAALLIAFDYEMALMNCTFDYDMSLMRYNPSIGERQEVRPNLRPRGNIEESEMIWVLDILKAKEITWRVRGFNRAHVRKTKELREAIRRLDDSALERRLKKVCDFTLEPRNDKKGCIACGYPGPLILTEDPPLCVHCLIKRVKNSALVRGQVEQILKIEPLVS